MADLNLRSELRFSPFSFWFVLMLQIFILEVEDEDLWAGLVMNGLISVLLQ